MFVSDHRVALLLMGHVYMIMLAMLCQTIVYREVTALFSLKSHAPESGEIESKGKKDPWSKTLNWYFFAVTNYFLYGESIIYYFKVRDNFGHNYYVLNWGISMLYSRTVNYFLSLPITELSALRCIPLASLGLSCLSDVDSLSSNSASSAGFT